MLLASLEPHWLMNLELGPAVSTTTAKLQREALLGCMDWLHDEGCATPLVQLVMAPMILSRLLARRAQFMFSAKVPLYRFLFLLTAIQHFEPFLRGNLDLAWHTASRWKELLPTVHRMPMPIALVTAMICLAHLWGWKKWAAITLFTFAAPARIGEVLKTVRSNLVTPMGLLDMPRNKTFIHYPDPKSGRRGGASQQHSAVDSVPYGHYFESVWQTLSSKDPLYPLSASSYRNRWNGILKALGIGKDADFTPGGLRGGARLPCISTIVPTVISFGSYGLNIKRR